VALLTAFAVGAHTVAAQQPAIRDSAGIRIVQNASRASAQVQFRVGNTPVLNVGGTENDPTNEFNHNDGYIRGVPLSNGGLAVSDVWRVQYFDSRGARVRVSGTRGRGPNELLYQTNICVTRGDTVVVTDSQNQRIAVLDERGNVVRTFRRPMGAYLAWNSCLADGTIVFSRSTPTTAGRPDQMTLIRTRLDSTVVNTFAPIDLPLPGTVVSSAHYVAARDRIYLSTGADNQINEFTPAGVLTRIIRTADPLRALSAEEFTTRTNSARATAARTGRPAAAVPTHFPPWREFLVGSDGMLWALEY
jgi:hypothetical protein